MNNTQKLIFQYKEKINNIGLKEIVDIYNEWINKDFVEDATLEEKERIKQIVYIELLDSDRFRKSKEKKEDLLFRCFTIKDKGIGKDYYQLQRSKGYEVDKIYAIMEEKTGYIGGNCNKLVLDLMIERGIKNSDYNNNTMKLIEYLSRIEALENGWY